ncbi:unnamed protein product [Leptosia nina]|uniref:Uncharacterized protein n=1 Tax=Leptosia nina TaxID=320188 RepID=A0AAV1IU69_9NEOP
MGRAPKRGPEHSAILFFDCTIDKCKQSDIRYIGSITTNMKKASTRTVNSDVTKRHREPIKSRFYPHKFGQLTASPAVRTEKSTARFQRERDRYRRVASARERDESSATRRRGGRSPADDLLCTAD